MEPTLEQKVRDLVAALEKPKAEVGKARLIAMVAALIADVEGEKDIDPALFAAFPAETRLVTFQLLLTIIATSLNQQPLPR